MKQAIQDAGGACAQNTLVPHVTAVADESERINWIELCARVASVTVLGVFAYLIYIPWRSDPSRITLILLLVSAVLTVGMSAFAKLPKQRDWHPVAVCFSLGGSFYCLTYQLTASTQLIPEWAGGHLANYRDRVAAVRQTVARALVRLAAGESRGRLDRRVPVHAAPDLHRLSVVRNRLPAG
ncbi:isoprenylcysteine carboxyl methyltransferase [Burkholderia seminalis]|nr:isoprenylcysteine carboxyl methyltransferase [Burkholderia seminalis]